MVGKHIGWAGPRTLLPGRVLERSDCVSLVFKNRIEYHIPCVLCDRVSIRP